MRRWLASFTLTVTAVVVLASSSASSATELPEPVHQTRIEASFDPETGQLHGVERIRWRNTSTVDVHDLQLHLYLNAFASNRTTFMTESGGQLRGLEMDQKGWGWIEVDGLRLAYSDQLASGLPDSASEAFHATWPPTEWAEPTTVHLGALPDLKEVEEFIQPDDGNLHDRTVARYPLPRPVAPGDWVELEIAFAAQMPDIFARSGVDGDYVLGGQWFPKIGVFEDAGDRGRAEAGWNTHQYHASSEFYADFGDWDLELTLPARYQGRIGATGRLLEERVEGDQVVARFAQRGVHDVAWTADPKFVVIEELFDPVADVPQEQVDRIAALLGLDPEELALTPVTIRLLLQPEHRSQARRYLDAAKAALRGFGLRLGPYPYETLTLVDPARGALGSGGMEYPTFITLGTHPLLALPPFERVRMQDMVTVHEFGHNYFQGMIASNEFEEAWIDEGMTSYYEMVVMEETYGTQIELLGLTMTPFESQHTAVAGGRFTDAVVQPSWSYRSGGSYGQNSYGRAAVTLRHLEYLLGPETFHRAMRKFFQEWQFRHPSTADFEHAMRQATDSDIDWFLEQALHSAEHLDYAVRSVSSRTVRPEKGWFWEDGTRVKRGDDDDEEGGDEAAEDEDGPDDGDSDSDSDEEGQDEGDAKEYRTEVVVERRGGFRHPVTVALEYEDGEITRHRWDGQERWTKIVETRPAKLKSAEVDPDRVLALDVNRLNNGRRLEPNRAVSSKLLAHILFWLQNLLELSAVVG